MADTHSTCNKFASTSGSDGAGNGSFANPDATPQKLVDPLPGGQRGCFRRGTYNFSVTEVNSPDVTLAPYDRESVAVRSRIRDAERHLQVFALERGIGDQAAQA